MKDKSPRLVHSNDNSVSIYAQSATDLSDDEEQGQQGARSTPRGQLEVPSRGECSNNGIRKSNSFTSEQQETVMAFFGGTRLVNFSMLILSREGPS